MSVSSGLPFLGRFPVTETGPVVFISAESGKTVLRDQMRAVCQAREVDGRELPISWSFRRPQLANAAHLIALKQVVEEVEPSLILLDPTYLLISGGSADVTKNLFLMGEVLGGITDTLTSVSDATMILLHHVQKGAAKPNKNGELPILSFADLSYAGFVEWARQWLILSRLKSYEEGSGRHEVHISAGGSAAHSCAYALSINEGRPMDPIVGRKWEVVVSRPDEWRAANEPEVDEDEDVTTSDQVLAYLRTCTTGQSQSQVREACGLSAAKAKSILDELQSQLAISSEMVKGKTLYRAIDL